MHSLWYTNSNKRTIDLVFLSQLALLLSSSNSTATGLTMSLNTLVHPYNTRQGNRIKRSPFEVSGRQQYQTEDNKQPMFPAPTVHCRLPFCIELCSVELFGSVVLEQHGSEHEAGYDAEWKQFLCKQRLWWLDTELYLLVEPKKQ